METFFKVVTPTEALQMLLGATPVGAETLNTIEARGRVLAEDLYLKSISRIFIARPWMVTP